MTARSQGQLLRPSGSVPIALLIVSLAGAAFGVPRAAPQQPESDFRSLIEQRRPSLKRPGGPSEFYFTRGVYSSGWRWASWATDYPKADRQFMLAVNSLIDISAAEHENAIRLNDPEIRRYPFLYALEVGNMALTASEAAGLRDYLLAGGFLVIDDFWGSWEWANFEREIRRVLPHHRIVEVPLAHPIFNAVYRIDEVLQVPAIGNHWAGRTWEGGRLRAARPRHLRRGRPADGDHQLEHRPGRRLGVVRAAGVSVDVLQLRRADGSQLHRVCDEPLSRRRARRG